MEDVQSKYKKFKEHDGIYLGSLASPKALLFIGRSNEQKNSAPLQGLIDRLILDGYLLIWPKSRNQLICELLAKESAWAINWLNQIFGSNESTTKIWIRRFFKGLVLSSHPLYWDFFMTWSQGRKTSDQALNIKKMMQSIGGNRSVVIMSHSAGGITASYLANEPYVYGLICFGYPFRHPEKEKEDYRTKHLKNLKKPFLIIQGDKDEYGGLEVQNQYELSPNIELEFVEANHEYENLSSSDWLKVIQRIEFFMSRQEIRVIK